MNQLKENIDFIPDSEMPQRLRLLGKTAGSRADRIEQTIERDDKSAVCINFLRRTQREIDRIADVFATEVDTIAWAARNLFEISLLTQAVLETDKELKSWLGQLCGDEIQIIDGFFGLAGSGDDALRTRLKEQQEKLTNIVSDFSLPQSRPYKIKDLAIRFKLAKEYEAMYKLTSKLVHPSSWSLNRSATEVNSPHLRDILVIHAQQCTHVIINAVDKALGLDSPRREPAAG